MSESRGRRVVSAVVAMVLWSASFVGTRIAYQSFTPLWLGLCRFAVAGVMFVPVLALRKRHLPGARDLALIALSALVGITLYFAAENFGVQLTSAANASLVVGSFPAISIFVEAVWRGKAPELRALMGSLVALAGVALLTMGEASSGQNVLLGNAILLAGGIMWGVYNLVIQAIGKGVDVIEVTGYQTLLGALFFVPLAALEGVPAAWPTAEAWAALAFLALGCSLMAYLLYNYALERLEASTCAALLNLIPVFGVILSALVLGEPVTLAQVAGGAVILAGIFVGTSSGV